jgi:hypothetical protein
MLAVLLLVCGADPVPTFTVENKCPPAFTVTNRIPVTPPAKPAPKVRRWQDARGQWWEQEIVEPEAGKSTVPFPGTSDTTRDILAQPAAVVSMPYRGATLTGRTGTNAQWIIPGGSTNCGPTG